ncbi:major facilitator superfamily domain-containing protein [Talaromyces proteolyticus]|uniref:Major facilitator superfamily domain-containing protein n=1 Tax=Talaromyces proteolyticus TaxID=1131652 RepID=A0AAD4L5T5_9EURO|nr:major facilitator superfamily domain-containing protein [Talaromyces proteolyticus]KAH8704097.1 major facilitator superfamily domain-containing protein [Talaromyces proteolyticus]
MLVFPLLDETMIATLLAPISASFASLSDLSWIATTYLIGMAASNPLSGHVADVFGRRFCLIGSSAIFVIGTLICGLSTHLWVLLLGRAIQGFGSGVMQSVVSFIEADVVTLRNRGITEAVGGILFGVCLAVGGLYGGGMNDTIGWKWAFLIQVPVTIVLAIGAWLLVRIPKKKSHISSLRRLDYVGGIAILLAIVLFQLGLQSGGNSHTWNSLLVLVPLPLSLVSFIVFLVWDSYFAKEPVLPIKLLHNRNLYLSSIFYLLNSMSYFSIEFYIAIYLQVLGHSTTASGLRFIPQAFGAAASIMLAGIIVKITGKYYWLNVLAQIFVILSAALLLLLRVSSPSWYPFVFLGLSGAGFGISWVTVLMASLSSITDDHQASVQSAGYFFRFTGMALGMTVSTAVFQKILNDGLWSSFGNDLGAGPLINTLRTDFNAVQSLAFPERQKAEEDYMNALHAVFYTVTAEAIVAAIASLCLKENELPESLKEN